jgi:hypothetical protein
MASSLDAQEPRFPLTVADRVRPAIRCRSPSSDRSNNYGLYLTTNYIMSFERFMSSVNILSVI